MNALNHLSLLPFSKVEQGDFANQVITEILEGNTDPLLADLHLKAMEETLKKIRTDERVRDFVIETAEKYGKTFDYHGTSITVTQKTTKDFTGIDSVLDELYTQLEQIKAQIKAREAVVSCGVDPATGETFAPPKTSTIQFLTYKFK